MFKKIDIVLIALVLVLFFMPATKAQNEVNLPYSGFGVGTVNKSSCGILDAMGGTSYAMQSPYYINFMNPASYAAFDSLSFIADAAATIYSTKLSSNSATLKNSYARPNYISIGLPVTRHWRTSIGIRPFSTIGYNIVDHQTIDPIGKVSYLYKGQGGINQLYWGNAFKICKGLSIGLNTSYLFGNINNARMAEFDGTNFYNTRIKDVFNINGIYLTAGLQYFFNIKTDHRLGLGIVYGNTAHVWVNEKLLTNYYQHPFNSITAYDTVFYDDNNKGSMHIPQKVGFGLSYCHKDKLWVAADVTWQNWDKYSFMEHGDSLHDAISSSLGIQYVPDPTSGKFMKRLHIRAGFKYSTGEIILQDTRISEMGLTLGFGIPLTSFNTHSSMNFNFEFGQMGTLKNDLLRQNYFKFTFSLILQEKWYQKLKIE